MTVFKVFKEVCKTGNVMKSQWCSALLVAFGGPAVSMAPSRAGHNGRAVDHKFTSPQEAGEMVLCIARPDDIIGETYERTWGRRL